MADDIVVNLNTITHDVKRIEIVRYVAPIVIVSATTKAGRPIPGCKATVDYAELGQDVKYQTPIMITDGAKQRAVGTFRPDFLRLVAFSLPQDLRREPADGRWRTIQLLPDRSVTVAVAADGYAPASRTLSLPEGKIEEVNFVLTPH